MNEKQAIFFVNIGNRFGFDRSQLNFFGPKTTSLIEQSSNKIVESLEQIAFVDPKEFLDDLHYSWIIQAIEALPDLTKSLCIATLSARHAYPLLKHFKLQAPRKVPSGFFKQMTLLFLFKKCVPKIPLPKSLLPKSFLNQILGLSKNQLEHLFDRLGLYDLASELQEIVDKQVYLQTFKEITEEEKRWLLEILARKQLWALPKLGIGAWFKEKSLRYILQKRGILRFCIALSGMHPDFLWHLTHKLDTRRAQMINQMTKPEMIVPATSIVREQIRLAVEQTSNVAEGV